jgi:hypothetical protein
MAGTATFRPALTLRGGKVVPGDADPRLGPPLMRRVLEWVDAHRGVRDVVVAPFDPYAILPACDIGAHIPLGDSIPPTSRRPVFDFQEDRDQPTRPQREVLLRAACRCRAPLRESRAGR